MKSPWSINLPSEKAFDQTRLYAEMEDCMQTVKLRGQWDEKQAPASIPGVNWRRAQARPGSEGWLAIPVESALVRSMMNGESNGLAITAGRTFSIDSRESKFIPYLQLSLDFKTNPRTR